MSECVFCSSNEGDICSSCAQKVLLMNEEQLKGAHALAVEKGCTEKAEILGAYIEEIFDHEGNNAVERGSIRGRSVRGFRNQKKPTRSPQKRKRLSFR